MKNYLILTVLFVVSIFTSCKKEESNSSAVVDKTYASMSEIYTLLENKPKYLTVDAATGGSFYGNSGTRYVFMANSFVDASGTTVTGNVQVAVTEYLQNGDMIFSQMLPISNNEPLISGGEVNVVATQSGSEVFLKPGSPVTILMPQTSAPGTGFALFVGHANEDSLAGKVNWKKKDSIVGIGRVFVGPKDSLGILADSLNMCNADQFMSAPNYQDFHVTVTLPAGVVLGSTTLWGFSMYDGKKSAWPLGRVGEYANGVFHEKHVPDIPVHFVVFGLVNNRFYGGMLAVTPAAGGNYTVSLTQADPATFKGQVNALSN